MHCTAGETRTCVLIAWSCDAAPMSTTVESGGSCAARCDNSCRIMKCFASLAVQYASYLVMFCSRHCMHILNADDRDKDIQSDSKSSTDSGVLSVLWPL